MENKEAIEKLRTVTAEFNVAMLNAALRKSEELRQNDDVTEIELFRFDFDSCEKAPVFSDDNKISINNNNLEYYWIEYKENEKHKKFALFFKDVDTTTHNVHVIPGLFEEYTYEETKETVPEDMPFVVVESGKAVIKNLDYINSSYRSDDQIANKKENSYPSFAEQDIDGGWWCPEKDYKHISTYNKKLIPNGNKQTAIDGLVTYSKNIFTVESKAAEAITAVAKDLSIKPFQPKTEKYKPVCWCNINVKDHSMYFTTPMYFKGCGFFTQYLCIRFGNEEKLESQNKNEIVVNCPVVDKNTKDFKAMSLLDCKLKDVEKMFKDFLNKN